MLSLPLRRVHKDEIVKGKTVLKFSTPCLTQSQREIQLNWQWKTQILWNSTQIFIFYKGVLTNKSREVFLPSRQRVEDAAGYTSTLLTGPDRYSPLIRVSNLADACAVLKAPGPQGPLGGKLAHHKICVCWMDLLADWHWRCREWPLTWCRGRRSCEKNVSLKAGECERTHNSISYVWYVTDLCSERRLSVPHLLIQATHTRDQLQSEFLV